MKKKESRIREDIEKLAAQARRLAEELASAAGDPDTHAAELRELRERHAETSRLLQSRLAEWSAIAPVPGQSGTSSRERVRPMREQALDALHELGVPASPRTVSMFAQARYNWNIPTKRFSSLRRDDRNAFDRDPVSRPAWLAPAINVTGLTSIPRILTSSAWPLPNRLIGSRTLRVNHLQTLRSLIRCHREAAVRGDEASAALLLSMARRQSHGLPGFRYLKGHDASPLEQADQLAAAELEKIAPMDRDERDDAADRLKGLSLVHRVWGKPSTIDGRAERVGGA